MAPHRIALIHPPVVKPSEAPAGIARLAGALNQHGIQCHAIDANIQAMHFLIGADPQAADTWSRRAHRNRTRHLDTLRTPETYTNPDRYRRAVADLNRLLSINANRDQTTVSLADYQDRRLSPLSSADLITAAKTPERNPFFKYYHDCLIPALATQEPDVIGISVNYLSQALCAFALVGALGRYLPRAKIVLGGGLVTSWRQHGPVSADFDGLLHAMIAGPGEGPLLQMVGVEADCRPYLPDYTPFESEVYLAPAAILPFSASQGCWWRRCAFCPERAERRPFQPLRHSTATAQLNALSRTNRPGMIHLLDNAVSPALLRALVKQPPGAPWYGFVRMTAPLDDYDFCRSLAASGCSMLKLGLESGDQKVLDALNKGVGLKTASRILRNLRRAGIATYVYLLFGTPAEDHQSARRTLQFVVDHSEAITFLNMAIFNLPIYSPEAASLKTRHFYRGDLALYKNFEHPRQWSRIKIRRFLDKEFKRQPAVRPILRRDPLIFTSNHAAFFHQYRQ